MPIRFAILADAASLAPWQRACLAPLTQLDGATALTSIDTSSSDAAALRQLAGLELDFILTWSDEPLAVELTRSARWGVWRYQFGDWQRPRGQPPGFWEVYEGRAISTVALVKVQADPEYCIVLREAHLRTHPYSARRNLEQLQARCAPWAAQLCVDISNGLLEQFSRAPIRCPPIEQGPPSGLHRLGLAARAATRRVLSATRALLRHEQWNVGVVEQPVSAFLDPSRRAPTRWLANPGRSEFFADPFGISHDGRLTVLCEYLSYSDNQGRIVSLNTDGEAAAVGIGPTPAVHLSYPCLIRLNERLLCIPETHQAREIALYEAERFPDRWRKVATLVANTAAVDATPFRYADRWWLAASTPESKGANCELHLWHAPDITGPWQAHPGNPVKVDVRSARPAGLPFEHAGVLYRPAQDCSVVYGGRTVINRVTTLTPSSFREEFAAAVEPDGASPYPEGLHTLSAVGSVTLIDGKRSRFVPAQFRRTLTGWLRSAL